MTKFRRPLRRVIHYVVLVGTALPPATAQAADPPAWVNPFNQPIGARPVLGHSIAPLTSAPMTFSLEEPRATSDWRWTIFADGVIDLGTTERLKAQLASRAIGPTAKISLYLNSPGGDLGEGLKLGHFVRDWKMDTAIGATPRAGDLFFAHGGCFSACTFSFLGGVRRSTAGSDYGVHRFYTSDSKPDPNAIDTGQVVTAILFDFVREMGADPSLINEMIKASGSGINILPPDRLDSLRVNTPLTETRWELVAEGGILKAKAIIDDGTSGRHLIEFTCTRSAGGPQLSVLMRHNAREARDYYNGMVISTWLVVDDGALSYSDVAIQADEVLVEPRSNLEGVSIVFRATPRILSLLQTTRSFGVKFSSESWPTATFLSDFEKGRKLVLDFAETCQ